MKVNQRNINRLLARHANQIAYLQLALEEAHYRMSWDDDYLKRERPSHARVMVEKALYDMHHQRMLFRPLK